MRYTTTSLSFLHSANSTSACGAEGPASRQLTAGQSRSRGLYQEELHGQRRGEGTLVGTFYQSDTLGGGTHDTWNLQFPGKS